MFTGAPLWSPRPHTRLLSVSERHVARQATDGPIPRMRRRAWEREKGMGRGRRKNEEKGAAVGKEAGCGGGGRVEGGSRQRG